MFVSEKAPLAPHSKLPNYTNPATPSTCRDDEKGKEKLREVDVEEVYTPPVSPRTDIEKGAGQATDSRKPRKLCTFRPTYGEIADLENIPDGIRNNTRERLIESLKSLGDKALSEKESGSRKINWIEDDYLNILSSFDEIGATADTDNYDVIVSQFFRACYAELTPDEQAAVKDFVRKEFDNFSELPVLDKKLANYSKNLRELHIHLLRHFRLVNKLDVNQWNQLDDALYKLKGLVKVARSALKTGKLAEELVQEIRAHISSTTELIGQIKQSGKLDKFMAQRFDRIQKLCNKISNIENLKEHLETLKTNAAIPWDTSIPSWFLAKVAVTLVITLLFTTILIRSGKNMLSKDPIIFWFYLGFTLTMWGSFLYTIYIMLPSFRDVKRAYNNAAEYYRQLDALRNDRLE